MNNKILGIVIVLLVILCIALFAKIVMCCNCKKSSTKNSADKLDTVFGQGEKNPYGKFFIGQTYLQRLVAKDDIFNSSIANVTFEAGARTNWHKHSGGQLLLVIDGEGRYQEEGKELQILHKGDIVKIAPNVKHWHGASPDSWFTHISVETNIPNNQTDWLEPVDETYYK